MFPSYHTTKKLQRQAIWWAWQDKENSRSCQKVNNATGYGHKCPWLLMNLRPPFNISPATSECTLGVSPGSRICQHTPSLPTTLPLGIPWAFSKFSESLLKLVHSSVSLFLSLSKKLPSPKLQNWDTTMQHYLQSSQQVQSYPKIEEKKVLPNFLLFFGTYALW